MVKITMTMKEKETKEEPRVPGERQTMTSENNQGLLVKAKECMT
jgi:hypothetical protein